MPYPSNRPDVRTTDFDGVLSTLQGWLGREVSVAVDVTDVSLTLLSTRGALAASKNITRPFDEDEFEFTVGDRGGFALRRAYCAGGDVISDRTLIVAVTEQAAEDDDTVTAFLHIGLQG